MSRLHLSWYNLEQQPGKDVFLKIPIGDVYSGIIDRAFPDLDHIGWRDGTKGTRYTYVKSIAPEEHEQLVAFLELLKELLCITRTEILEGHFKNELAEAYAIDFNFEQGKQPLEYTNAGKAEHLAKEEQHPKAIEGLAKALAKVIELHPTMNRADFIAAVPPRPSKDFHLPVELVKQIGGLLNRDTGLAVTKIEHEKLKNLAVEDKVKTLLNAFTLHEPVKGKTIVLIDDLYQSGVTLWSLARFLKQNGARAVYGLTCVKSWSDSDNV
jgi:predicted amidophosphoribosyltransferase